MELSTKPYEAKKRFQEDSTNTHGEVNTSLSKVKAGFRKMGCIEENNPKRENLREQVRQRGALMMMMMVTVSPADLPQFNVPGKHLIFTSK